MAKATDSDILIDHAVLAAAETSDRVETSLTVQKQPFGAVLDDLVRPLGLAYRAVGPNAIQVISGKRPTNGWNWSSTRSAHGWPTKPPSPFGRRARKSLPFPFGRGAGGEGRETDRAAEDRSGGQKLERRRRLGRGLFECPLPMSDRSSIAAFPGGNRTNVGRKGKIVLCHANRFAGELVRRVFGLKTSAFPFYFRQHSHAGGTVQLHNRRIRPCGVVLFRLFSSPSSSDSLGKHGREQTNDALPARPVWLAAAGVGLLGLLATAAVLRPSPSGHGTHQQLGLPPCTFWVLFHRPCPTCGMTTAWAHLMRGEWIDACRANTGGVLLGVLAMVAAPWLLGSAIRGRWLAAAPSERSGRVDVRDHLTGNHD